MMTFIMPNFRRLSKQFQIGDANSAAGEIILMSDEYRMTLQTNLSGELRKEIKKNSGYLITQYGSIERVDSRCFGTNEVDSVCMMIKYFFSFARGAFTGPIVLQGLDEKGAAIWEQWNTHLFDRLSYVESWFWENRPENLMEFFAGFCGTWNNDRWKEPLRRAIYWYLKSNAGGAGAEGSIILGQAALELLSWNYFTKDRDCVTEEGFTKMLTTDRIGLLLSACEIPLKIPAGLKDLSKYSANRNQDGPKAITDTRNLLIHPHIRSSELQEKGDVLMDVRELALWYIEMVILKVCNYNGECSSRVAADRFGWTAHNVPWRKN